MRFLPFLVLIFLTVESTAQHYGQNGFYFGSKRVYLQNASGNNSITFDPGLGYGFEVGGCREWQLQNGLGFRFGLSYSTATYTIQFFDATSNELGTDFPLFTTPVDGSIRLKRAEFIAPASIFKHFKIKESRFSFRYGASLAYNLPVHQGDRYQIIASSIPATSSFFPPRTNINVIDAQKKMANASGYLFFGIEMVGTGKTVIVVEPYYRFVRHRFPSDLVEGDFKSGVEWGTTARIFLRK